MTDPSAQGAEPAGRVRRRLQEKGERGPRTPAGAGPALLASQRAGARGPRGPDSGDGRAGREEKETSGELQRRRIFAMSGCGSVAERKGRGEPRVGE